jgi:hypothetical protein
MYSSITVDYLNNPYIAYYDVGNRYLKLAYKEANQWEIKNCCHVELVEGLSAGGRSTAIQLEQMGSFPLILFFDFASSRLKLAIYDRNDNTFKVEDVRDGQIIQDLSLVLDTGNQPHIGFSEVGLTGTESVWYGWKACLAMGCITQTTPNQPTGEGSWHFEQVNMATGNFVSLKLDHTQNRPWMTYYSLSYGLRLAQKSETGWLVETVDPGWYVGLYNSMALDSDINSRISYYDQINMDLKYASTTMPCLIDVWLKDCSLDDGNVGSTPICDKWQFSPDIWFDNNGFWPVKKPIPGVGNTLKARIRNRGFATATNVTVKFYVSKLNSSLPFPENVDNIGTLIGQRVVNVPPGGFVTTSIQWTPPAWIRTQSWVIGVVLDHPSDHAVTPFVLPPNDNNFAVLCFPH